MGEGGTNGSADAVGGALARERGKNFSSGGCWRAFEEAEQKVERVFVAGRGKCKEQNFLEGTARRALPFLFQNVNCLGGARGSEREDGGFGNRGVFRIGVRRNESDRASGRNGEQAREAFGDDVGFIVAR